MLWNKVVVTLVVVLISYKTSASGTVSVDGKDIKTRNELHSLLIKQLNFPTYYGRSLNSIYEVLSTDFRGDNIIKIKHASLLKAKLGTDYIDGFIQSILDASEDNSRVVLVIE